VGGCFGGQRSQPAATATSTGTPTRTEASPEAARHIDAAQDQFSEAVFLFTGGVTDDLLSVTAETESFRARDVLLRLDRVQEAIAEAEAAATTDEQRAAVAALDAMQRFLTLATDAQSWLIDGHDALTEAYAHLDDGELDDAAAEIERVETAAEEVSAPTTTIREEIDAASASSTDTVDEDEFDAKVEQLTAESDVLATLSDSIGDIEEGIAMMGRARDEVDDGRTERAAETADRAYDTFSDVEDELGDLTDDFPEGATAFEEVAENLRYLASRQAADAEELYETHA
jgi:archaellum component FlaC